ncbi:MULTISPECIES: hypothetical protein [Sphingobacterium]|uniref:DUF4836 domain-containing protein n=1 Tax=Sphingobacterium athyrii TaxID=2152717 RepID=A0A363NY77_9SPHI|nr:MULTISPECIES: hypothetical protein [Sphingobacterium]PUV25621.1 hypothetical protein DCO56_01145 [Sphingobacterium athyrii]QIH33613.1 DUF4836 family protein [Sphingobacterium sp. DR205]
MVISNCLSSYRGRRLLRYGFGVVLCLGAGFGTVYAQGSVSKIPDGSNTVVAINLAKVVEPAEAATLNKLLDRIGFFKYFEKKDLDLQNDFQQTGVDAKGVAVYYRNNRDSLLYGELILPIADIDHFERLLKMEGTSLPVLNGYSRLRTADGQLLAWNAKELRVLKGEVGPTYFANDSIAGVYGIENIDYAAAAVSAATAADEAAANCADSVLTDSATMEWDAFDFDTLQTELQQEEGEPLEIYDNPINYDSLDTTFEEVDRRNDSIKNILLEKWLLHEQEQLLSGKYPGISAQEQARLVKNIDLVRVWLPKIDGFYNELHSVRSIVDAYYNTSNFSLERGYRDMFFDLAQQRNKIMLKTSVTLGKDLISLTKKLYARKPNPKFAKYLTAETFAYFNVNVNTEAYLKEIPVFFTKNLKKYFGKENEVLELMALGLEIALDEKAIAKIMPGDNLVVVNGITNLKIDYVDYDYDDNYDVKEVHKTKEERVPSFIWMFTSEDQRIFKKALDVAVSKADASFAGGIYKIKQGNGKEFPLYLMFHEDLVMISNDSLQLNKILHKDSYSTKSNASFVKLMKGSKFSAAFQTKKIPGLTKDLNLILGNSWRATLDELNNYGNFTLSSKGIVGDRLETDLQLELPTKANNALQFVINQLLDGIVPDEQYNLDEPIDVTDND